jgi:transcriptional regulator with PAS, ATPase and Fis domain
MNNKISSSAEQPVSENERLRCRIAELEQIEKKYRENLDELSRKEAFNFALFQYNPAAIVVVDREGRVVKSNAAKKRAGERLPNIGDIMYKDYASHHLIDMNAELMEAMATGATRRFDEQPYNDKILSITIAPFPQGAIIISEDITEQKNTERDRTTLIGDLRRALDEVETLRGLLPICASCKKIRDDKGYWNHIEVYFSNHAHVDFTHTLCPDCIRHFYPEYWRQLQERANTRVASGD